MSDRHPKRSRCQYCGEVTRIAPTQFLLLVKQRRLRMYEPREAQFCESCRENWLEPTQLALWPEIEWLDEQLPGAAPLASEEVRVTLSWPLHSTWAERDRRLSLLVGSRS